MDHLASFQSLRRTMERCSEIVSDTYSMKPEDLLTFKGELPPGHKTGHRRQMYWVSEEDGDLVVSLPGTTHPLDWSSNMCVHYTPINGSHPPAGTPTEQLEKMPCAHAGFYFRAETIPTLALLEQAAAKGLRLVLTGHSLGAAVANLCTLTALSAQKKAREAAANAACARRASSSAGAADEQDSSSSSSSGCSPQQQNQAQQQQKANMSPFEAAAAAAVLAAEEAHHNHSWCSANSDILVSPQAALVDIVCVAFASPHWANQSLADYIEDNDWGEVFVNVVVPEDYCLKLFNNVLTSANPAERHSLSRSSSKVSMHDSSSDSQLADDADAACDPEALHSCPAAAGLPAQPYAAAGGLGNTASEPSTLENMCSVLSEDSSCTAGTATAGSTDAGEQPRYSYQPGGTQQPLVSALAGTRRKQKKVQLGFDLPDQKTPLPQSGRDATAAADTSAAAAAGGADSLALLDTHRPPAVITSCSSDTQPPGLFATDRGSWSELQGALPSSPSCASLSSLSSLNSTRSWTLLAYLPDVLIRTFSSSSGSNSCSLDDIISPGSSDGGCPHAAADAIAAAIAGAAAASVAPPSAGALPLGSGPYSSSHNTSTSSSFNSSSSSSSLSKSGFGLRHAKSSVDLSISSLTDSPRCATSSSSSTMACLDDSALGVQSRGLGGVCAAGATAHLSRSLQQQQSLLGPTLHRGLRRSATSASLNALTRHSQKLLSPLKISNSLSVIGALLPSLRSITRASRAVMRTASNVKEAAFNVPLSVFEAGLIKALKPPMYKPVGQQWILSATGLVPQAQPIYMYPKHVHDVYWHKDLALMAFKEHSIVFYKTRLLQQASRR